MKYKNTSESTLTFRAAKTADKPNVKKVYVVGPGKEVEVPVKIEMDYMELVSKKTKKGDE